VELQSKRPHFSECPRQSLSSHRPRSSEYRIRFSWLPLLFSVCLTLGLQAQLPLASIVHRKCIYLSKFRIQFVAVPEVAVVPFFHTTLAPPCCTHIAAPARRVYRCPPKKYTLYSLDASGTGLETARNRVKRTAFNLIGHLQRLSRS